MGRSLFALPSLLLAGAAFATASPATGIFDLSALATWSPIEESATVPYLEEGLRSELLFAARSPDGSYVFVTRIDNTLSRDAAGPEEIQAYFSQETYQDLAPVGFSSDVITLGRELALRAVVVSFRTNRLPYDAGTGGGSMLVKTVCLPVVIKDSRTLRYRNEIHIANFRGSPSRQDDQRAFDRLWQQAKLSDPNLSLVELERFNALRPELVEDATTAEVPRPPVDELRISAPQTPEPEPAALAQPLLASLADRASVVEAGELQRFADEHPGTTLAQVFRYLDGPRLAELEAAVWKQAWQDVPAEQNAWLAAIFLVESIAAGDARMAERVARDAAAGGASASALDCGKLGALLDLLLPVHRQPLLTRPEVRQFFRLDSRRVCSDLRSLLGARAIEVPQLEVVAVERRSGTLELGASMSTTDLPRLAVRDGQLVLLKQAASGKARAIESGAIQSLLDVVDALDRTGER